ncbi:unnamed protein product [Prorocentrum cordatum]|uniref:Uncharacterized protein n=1 Tax=Prorocentrum cordatum TaxID=2364126 RepID=A0ABN9YB22_9DINO|nr:unnamed protein product [Polarella glacialis]
MWRGQATPGMAREHTKMGNLWVLARAVRRRLGAGVQALALRRLGPEVPQQDTLQLLVDGDLLTAVAAESVARGGRAGVQPAQVRREVHAAHRARGAGVEGVVQEPGEAGPAERVAAGHRGRLEQQAHAEGALLGRAAPRLSARALQLQLQAAARRAGTLRLARRQRVLRRPEARAVATPQPALHRLRGPSVLGLRRGQQPAHRPREPGAGLGA